MKNHRWTSHDRPKTKDSRGHERFNRVNDVFYGHESSNGLHNTNRYTANERRLEQEKYDRKPESEKLRPWDNKYLKKSHDNYKHEDGQEYPETKSPATREMSTLYHTFLYRLAIPLLMLPR